MKFNRLSICGVVLAAAISASAASPVELVVQTNRPGATIQPTMYGLFFEDINYAADGGLYAELVKNRSFEFPQNLMGWDTFGNVELRNDGPFERNPHYVRLSSAGHREKYSGLQNEGFFGIGVKEGEQYRFSTWARVPDGAPSDTATLYVELVNPRSMAEDQDIARIKLKVSGSQWQKYTAILSPSATESRAELRIALRKPDNTPVDLEHISLFPVDTWKGHENGMRKDLAQRLADLKPGIFRFPGGCIVEGTDPATRYQWKNTVGPVENRPLNENRWHYTFYNRLFPEYFQSGGLGFYEFFLLSEELGSEPLPILNVGLICQYQNSPDQQIPVDSIDVFVQDALDLIEFANGDTTTTWGALRAEMGHPAPFNLKYIGIGNEQWGPEYVERLQHFIEPIRKAWPDVAIVGSSGPQSEGEDFDYLWPEMRRLKADLVDEHFYRPAEWFIAQGNRYDDYDRRGPKVFAGEYACHTRKRKYNNYTAALMEAAFMTGLERNADVVHMATYAPLFAHVEGWQWRPDLIWFDNLRSVPSASYFVQQLYAENKGTRVLPLTLDGRPAAGNDGQQGIFASAVLDEAAGGEIIIKVANTADEPRQISVRLDGLKKHMEVENGEVITLTPPDGDLWADNILPDGTMQDVIRLQEAKAEIAGGNTVTILMQPSSFSVIRLSAPVRISKK